MLNNAINIKKNVTLKKLKWIINIILKISSYNDDYESSKEWLYICDGICYKILYVY